ncbi:Peroxiredoxin-like 2A/B/C [Arabidopsis suecica]|nr:thioredoxin-like protein AAED1, chloroplastic [Arabidopsis lyrata subsp. lyrata]KAG7539354.1 Peroxiredoxin-like 2A/B/C [Arabidopsis suecica]|eukprot:XP_020885160.1 thioredoxin-like protein AAED1, chloroplastic [Arabidopsis lyrata subsp. lyrata]
MILVSDSPMAILSLRSSSSLPLICSTISPMCSKPLSQLPSNFSSSIASVPFTKLKSSYSSVSPISRPRMVSARAATESITDYREDIGEILGDVSIFTASGQRVQFSDLWDQKDGIAAVVLLRHFGCVCCWELATALKEAKPRFDAAGVKLIAVGVGTPDKARILATRLPFPMECLYADPERKAYDVLGLYYGLGRTFFNPASTKVFSRFNEIREATKNYTIEATPEDRSSVLQQGGTFVFRGKKLLYGRKDEGTGDHPSLDDVINVCCKATVA